MVIDYGYKVHNQKLELVSNFKVYVKPIII